MKRILISMMMLSSMLLAGCRDNREVRIFHAQWVFYGTFDAMAERATDVVRAEILSSTLGERWGGYQTIYEVRILEVFQGDLQIGDKIELAQLGGESAYRITINLEKIPIEIGDDLVLFLLNNDPTTPAGLLHQGAYRLSESLESDEKMDASIELIPIVPEGMNFRRFHITVKELWGLREQWF